MDDLSESLGKLCFQSLKTYLHYHNAYRDHTWQGGDLKWGTLTHKVIESFDNVVLKDHVINLKDSITTAECLWPPNVVEF